MTEPRTFTQEELDNIITDRLARQKRRFEDKLASLEDEKNKAKLLEAEEFKLLAEQLQGQLNEQVGLKDQVEKYEEIMKAVLDSELEGLSDAGKKAIESLPGNAEAKLEWLTANKEVFAKESGDGVGSPILAPERKVGKKSKFQFTGI